MRRWISAFTACFKISIIIFRRKMQWNTSNLNANFGYVCFIVFFFSDRWLTLTNSKQVLQEGDGKLQFHWISRKIRTLNFMLSFLWFRGALFTDCVRNDCSLNTKTIKYMMEPFENDFMWNTSYERVILSQRSKALSDSYINDSSV